MSKNYILTKRQDYFNLIGDYDFCNIDDVVLPKKIAVDTETTGLQCYHTDKGFRGADLFAIQIGTGSHNYLFDLEGGYTPKQVFDLLKGKILVLQNAIFDIRFMFKHGFIPYSIRDTFLASKILYNGARDGVYSHNFGAIMFRELGIKYDKSVQKNIAKNKLGNKQAIQYCFNDVDRLLELEDTLFTKIKEEGQLETYKLQCRATLPLAYMEMCGLPLSKIRWKDKILRDKKAIETVEKEIINYIQENLPKYIDNQINMFSSEVRLNLNLNSTTQMIPVFKDLEINILNDKNKESLNEKVVSKNKHPFVDLWLKRQKLQKALSTFGENVLEKAIEGRIYTSFNPMVDTSRISCRKGGINFLNFPRDKVTRSSFVASKGYKMVGADYSNQEVFMGADMHHDAATLDSIKNGSCLHCAFTRVLFPEVKDLSDQEIKDNHSEKRQQAKAPRFCFQYGGSAFTLHKNEGISMKRAKIIEEGFKKLHKGIYDWGDKKLAQSIKQGYVESVGGFKLYLPNYDTFKELEQWYNSLDNEFWEMYKVGKSISKKYYELTNKEELTEKETLTLAKVKTYLISPSYALYREARPNVSKFAKLRSEYFKLCLNNPAQSGAAFQTKAALVALFKEIVKRGDMWEARISNSPYDEILMETKEHLAETYKEIMEKCMIEEGNKWLSSHLFSMEADAGIGDSWWSVH